MRACTVSSEPSLHRKINAVGTLASLYKKKKSDPISVLHVAVGVLVRMCTGTCTVSHAPSLLGIVLNLAEIRALENCLISDLHWLNAE